MPAKIIKTAVLNTIFIIITLVSIFPFYLMFIMGTHKTEFLFKGIVLLPGNFTGANLLTAISSGLPKFYMNSLIVSFTSVILCVVVSTMTGFVLAKYKFRFNTPLFVIILLSMMIPTQLGLVAYVLQMRIFRLTDTLIPLIPPWIAYPFGVFWIRQNIAASVPDEILESARLDGASEPRILLQIVPTCIRPAIITISMLVFLWSWNNYLLPLVVINKQNLYTIPLGLSRIGDMYRIDYAAKIFGLSLGTLPLMLIFIFGSNNFVNGLTAGAIKG